MPYDCIQIVARQLQVWSYITENPAQREDFNIKFRDIIGPLSDREEPPSQARIDSHALISKNIKKVSEVIILTTKKINPPPNFDRWLVTDLPDIRHMVATLKEWALPHLHRNNLLYTAKYLSKGPAHCHPFGDKRRWLLQWFSLQRFCLSPTPLITVEEIQKRLLEAIGPSGDSYANKNFVTLLTEYGDECRNRGELPKPASPCTCTEPHWAHECTYINPEAWPFRRGPYDPKIAHDIDVWFLNPENSDSVSEIEQRLNFNLSVYEFESGDVIQEVRDFDFLA
ncbi:hypothetical protein BT63DRAFT_452234 [Microthyrium microscopicum]|uniref:Uncharacterized protein n=1 Tax=Microthyrium microscopicum TaxID=703497 RepID=A0A6A6UJM2_9PEZI|nr:hypothetical protein BT63DRAFT_452234 [Microthyrium microscopicum]